MRDIRCPKDIGFENTFSGKDCEKEQYYNNCYHCWSTALAKEKCPICEYEKEDISKHGNEVKEKDQANEKAFVTEIRGRDYLCVGDPAGDYFVCYALEGYGRDWRICETGSDTND